MTEIDGLELEQFNNLCDNLIEDIEAGRVTANPLAPEAAAVDTVDGREIVAQGSATERGELEMEEFVAAEAETETPATTESDDNNTINGKSFVTHNEPMEHIVGNAGKVLIVVSGTNGEVVFGSAAVAARETGLNPTTVRTRCSKEYVDGESNTWMYRDKPTV